MRPRLIGEAKHGLWGLFNSEANLVLELCGCSKGVGLTNSGLVVCEIMPAWCVYRLTMWLSR